MRPNAAQHKKIFILVTLSVDANLRFSIFALLSFRLFTIGFSALCFVKNKKLKRDDGSLHRVRRLR